MRYDTLLKRDRTVLVVVDIQEKLLAVYEPAMRDRVVGGSAKLISGVRALGLPVVLTEQYPRGLGPTHGQIKAALGEDLKIIEKTDFSCCGEPGFMEALEKTGRKQALVCGMEAHVCVQQTALDLLARGYQVHVCRDAVASRREEDFKVGLARMNRAGVIVTTVESALFEMLESCKDERFRAVLKIIK